MNFSERCHVSRLLSKTHVTAHLVLSKVADISGWVASPDLPRWHQSARGQHSAGSQNTLLLHQGALHQDAPVADDALVLHSG